MRSLSGILLVISFVLNMGGVLLFNGHFLFGWFVETPMLLRWERGFFMAAYFVAALGVTLLGDVLREDGTAVLARLGITAFLMAAIVAIVAEATFLSEQGSILPLVFVMVVMLFLAEAILGWALLNSDLLPTWIGWMTVIWNIGWLIVLAKLSRSDMYYPILHFIPLLWSGISLARRAA